jgi:HD-like signal output (HDOD) protein
MAYFAQHLCREMRLPSITGEEAFLAGLLHESGRFILADNFPDQFGAACQVARATDTALAPRLREAFRTSPAQITAYILELWGMPATIIAAIALQDAPAADESKGFTLASALYVADGVASRQTPRDMFAPDWEKLSLGAKPGVS